MTDIISEPEQSEMTRLNERIDNLHFEQLPYGKEYLNFCILEEKMKSRYFITESGSSEKHGRMRMISPVSG